MLGLFPAEIIPYVVFVLRVANSGIGTVRVIAMNRQQRALGFALASLESLMFAYTAGVVLTDLNNVPHLAAYVLGFAVGGYVGMYIEDRYLNLYEVIDIIAPVDIAHEIAVHLRDAGHGVTETRGIGARGEVMQLRVVSHHRDVRECLTIARTIKPDVFITIEESRFIANGWLKQQQQHHR